MPFTAIDVLTAALVVITAYYAWQTRRQAQLTKEAIDAAHLSEETQLRPYVHVTRVHGVPQASREPPDHFDLDLNVDLKNLGRGAAISVSGTLQHDDVSLVQSSGPANLSGNGETGMLVFHASTVAELPFYNSLPQHFRLTLVYHDVASREWRTHGIVRADSPVTPTSGPPVVFEYVDEAESIELIGVTVPRVVGRP